MRRVCTFPEYKTSNIPVKFKPASKFEAFILNRSTIFQKSFKGDAHSLSYVVLAVKAGRIYTPNSLIRNGIIVLENGKISYVGDDFDKAKDATILKFDDGICTPGFIDVHVHGGGGYDFADGSLEAFSEVCRYHVRGGTTSLLATILSSP
ncbi:hypothetical protein KEJ48_07085, partial [Candidatus Bathyarchaeota archaeon]|nr:hypothetical protein [Candidatus Bathyarchaeota archaeon]